jgi:hypothetical protein
MGIRCGGRWSSTLPPPEDLSTDLPPTGVSRQVADPILVVAVVRIPRPFITFLGLGVHVAGLSNSSILFDDLHIEDKLRLLA